MEGSNEESRRLKFLCSFNGSILPRPQDGKLRYVGGETRIVSVPRDIGFEELMARMKELFEGASVLKYQQPDEDLDALVSVVNDDDVTNMMEEYDKLGSGDGFTRLRMFLFSKDDFVEGVERRYVDALNDSPEFGKQQMNEFLQVEEMPLVPQRYSEMEPPWSPAYYSPRHPANDFLAYPFGEEDHFSQPPGSLLQTSVNNVCSPFSRNHQVINPCADCPPNAHPGWMRRAEEPRPYNYGGRGPYIVDNNGMTVYPDGGNELFHDQPISHEERGVRYGNFPYAKAYGRNVQNPQYEALGLPQQENDACNLRFIRTRMEPTPSPRVRVDNQNPLLDFSLMPNPYSPCEPMLNCSNPIDVVVEPPPFLDDKVLSLKTFNTASARKVDSNGEAKEEKNANSGLSSNFLPAEKIIRAESSHNYNPEKEDLEVKCLSYVPQYIESVKKAALEDVEEVKGESALANEVEETAHELDAVDPSGDLEVDSDNETLKIEPTKAEEEAIAKGLQTIKNDDLEEIRELGSGTYGAVYHGKWKGSDVAIKRIKASCFAGKPSERERLIAEFWREALILSSLHHPNVVSFYGIVRDGPDGSLATVTEFMVNGSLKQFLQKKDRTIDRRKRLIIAMDAAFGMEYLHGKNIVHFDLKCENLLVNMRDPHRPICKIGDLGLSKVKQHTLVSGGVRGTLPWMAPELLSGKSHMVTEKIDVYSFGIVMWELLTGDEPYGDMHCSSIIGGIVNNSLRPTIPTWCDPEWKSLMGSCWAAEPAQRPSFSQVSQKLRTMAVAMNVK